MANWQAAEELQIAFGEPVGVVEDSPSPGCPPGYDLLANGQIAGRTSPSLLDMIAAMATGLAGAVAIAHRDVAAVLPGVAISISLVPPLAVVGICLGRSDVELALGALVLFFSNFLALVLAGTIVYAVVGTCPRDRPAARRIDTACLCRPRRHDRRRQPSPARQHAGHLRVDRLVPSSRDNRSAVGPGECPTSPRMPRRDDRPHCTLWCIRSDGSWSGGVGEAVEREAARGVAAMSSSALSMLGGIG